MNDEATPPLPPAPGPLPPLGTNPVNMKVRWILWVLASTVLPAIPWLTLGGSLNDEGNIIFALTIFALILQFAASVAVAIGFCGRRSMGTGGVIGMSIVFMLASVAIGTAVWFAVCVAAVSLDYK